MELRRDAGLEVRLLKRAVLAPSPPFDELDRALAAALGGTVTDRRREEAERDELRAALADSDRGFRALFEGMAEGIAVHELVEREGRAIDYRILDVNPSFERLTGLAVDEIRGRLASELYGMAAPFLDQYARVAMGGESVVIGAYFAPTKRHVRIAAVSPAFGRFATIIEDVTEQRHAAEERQRSEEERQRSDEERLRLLEKVEALTAELHTQSAQLEAAAAPSATESDVEAAALSATEADELRVQAAELAERVALAQALNALNRLLLATPGDEFLQRALDEGARALTADAAAIELREEPDWVVRVQCGLAAADVGRRLSRNEAPNATRAMRYREPFATADMQAAATDVGLASAHALRSALAVPLFAGEDVIGCLLFYGKSVRVFSDAEIDFGCALGAAVSLAIENARLRDEQRGGGSPEAG
jgi:PAS domain S-box-containing protein